MKVAYEVVKARREQLAQLLQSHQYLPLTEVCDRLRISPATARRDLAKLQKERAITRTYGGALCEFNQRFRSFSERQHQQASGKRRIARAAAALLNPGAVCYLDGGTTVYALAEVIAAGGPRPLTVVTNNLPVAELLSEVAGVELNLLGGIYLRRLSLLLGPKALESVRRWRFDIAFLGAEAMNADGLWNSQADVVAIQRAVAKGTPRVCFCVDAAKLDARAPEFLLPWEGIDRLATDASAAQVKAAGIRFARYQVIQA